MLSNKFQYISCYSLSGIPHLRCRDGMEVSIHLMLLFIVHFQIRKMPSNYGFNTSHVTLYQKVLRYLYRLRKSFNTSHVTLYRLWQYLTKILHLCFNTSHVTLYLNILFRQYTRKLFQYISCYSLSKAKALIRFVETGFQYISCYSLSWQKSTLKLKKKCFNTSHVTLYRLLQLF